MNRRVVKGVRFKNLKDAGDPVEVAKIYDRQKADELVFLDITASLEKRKTILEVVKKTAQNVFMPLTVGGGVRNLTDIRNLLNSGADKVSINTAAVKNPDLIRDASRRFGTQCIVVAIDAKRVGTQSKWLVYINGGHTPTDIDACFWAKRAQDLGAGELLLTSMDFDGTKDGFDIQLTKRISEAVNIPIIASGGAGSLEDFYSVLTRADADAALAASVFHYGTLTVHDVKKYLSKRGVSVRL